MFVADEVFDLAEALYEEESEAARKAGGLGPGARLVILDQGVREPPPDQPSERTNTSD